MTTRDGNHGVGQPEQPGEGWWVASDGNWYPPETHPDYVAPEPAASPHVGPRFEQPAAPAAEQDFEPPVLPATTNTSQLAASGSTTSPSEPAAAYPADLATAGSTGPSKSSAPLLIGGLAALLLAGAVAAFFLLRGDADSASDQGDRPEAATAIEEAEPTAEPSTAADQDDTETTDEVSVSDESSSPASSADPAPLSTSGPYAFDETVALDIESFGPVENATWNVAVSAPRDITAEVLNFNDFNDAPPDGVIFYGFDVDLTLAAADAEPVGGGFGYAWKVIGGATNSVYDSSSIDGLYGCGSVPNEFNEFTEVFVSGSVTGTVCIPLPAEDAAHPGTSVALDRANRQPVTFSADGGPGEAVPVGQPGPVTETALEAAFDAPTALTLDVSGPSDGSIWNVTVGEPVDITELVLEESFNDPLPDGLVYAGFAVETTLAEATNQPLEVGDSITWEILGGATNTVYDSFTFSSLFGCGSFDGRFSDYIEVFVGGTESGLVCVVLPEEDLASPDTVVSINVLGDRSIFSTGAAVGAPHELATSDGPISAGPLQPLNEQVELTWEVYGEADGSVWAVTVGPWSDVSELISEDNSFAEPAPAGLTYVGFDVELTLVEASTTPLSPGFDATWQVLGGSTLRAYEQGSLNNIFGCPLFDGAYDNWDEVVEGGTVSGTVCIPVPIDDVEHPDTYVALAFSEARYLFGPR